MSLEASTSPHDPLLPMDDSDAAPRDATSTAGASTNIASTMAEPDAAAPVTANYGGAWIGGVLSSLFAGRAPAGLPQWIVSARPVVVLLVDGLGWRMRHRFATLMPELAAFDGGPITSIVPSTTAAALPSLTTGKTPAEHGVLGDRMRVGGTTLNVLQWTVPHGAPPSPASVQPHQPFGGRRVPVVVNAKFENSGFSQAHLRGVPFLGYEGVDGLVAQVEAAVRQAAPLIFAYLPDADRIAHEFGLDHDAFAAALVMVDRVIARLRRVLPARGALVITADHGHVAVDPEQKVDLGALRLLLSGMSGSGRLRYLHARAGAVRELLPAARELVGQRAWVFDRDTLLSNGWLGPQPTPLVASRLGDVVLAARGAATMVDPSEGRINSLVTVHGSATADEMLVPLLAARGEGR